MRRLVFHSLAASAIYLLAGIGLEWASHTYRVEWLRFDAPDILLFFFPLALPFESFSRAVGWYALAPGMVILGCWLSGFLICFLSSLWIRGLIHRKQRAAYLTKSACAFLVFAALLIGCGNRDRVWLNLQMRNADQVRADCAKLLEKRRSTVKEELMEMRIPQSELPASISAIGAASALAGRDFVQINFLKEDGYGSAWGFLYDPHQTYLTTMPKWPPVKNTMYRDFYEFRIEGE